MSKEAIRLGRSKVIWAIQRKVLKTLPIRSEVKGEEHLNIVRELLAKGENVVAIIDHRIFADIVSGSKAILETGSDDLLGSSVFIIKLKYLENALIGLALKSIRVIGVVSSTMEGDPRQSQVNIKALRAVRDLPQGSLIVLAPEGTRVRTGKMEKARKEAASFWRVLNNAWLFPIALEGTEDQWPNGTLGGIKFIAGGFRKNMRVIFGEPVKIKDIQLEIKHYETSDKKQLEVDLAMLQIALLHMTQGDPMYTLGYYWEFLKNLEKKAELPSSRLTFRSEKTWQG